MAICTETVAYGTREFTRTYSDAGYYITRDGATYSEAVDPLNSGREYTETDTLIEDYETPDFESTEDTETDATETDAAAEDTETDADTDTDSGVATASLTYEDTAEDTTDEAEDTDATDDDSTPDSTWTKAEIKAWCDEHGITVYTSWTKAQMLAAVIDYLAAETESEED